MKSNHKIDRHNPIVLLLNILIDKEIHYFQFNVLRVCSSSNSFKDFIYIPQIYPLHSQYLVSRIATFGTQLEFGYKFGSHYCYYCYNDDYFVSWK